MSRLLEGVIAPARALSEGVYVVTHLRRSLEQRWPDIEEANDFLSLLQTELPHPNPYVAEGEQPTDPRHLGSGFWFSTYRFESSTGVWVAKIGQRFAPLKGYPPASDNEHCKLYNEQLQILYGCFQDRLPYLVPYPQKAIYISGERDTTVILQPFISDMLTLEAATELPYSQKEQIADEIDAFKIISQDMRKGFGLLPDLLNPGNLFVAPQSDGYHLTLVDNQCTNSNVVAPFINGANRMAFPIRIGQAKKAVG